MKNVHNPLAKVAMMLVLALGSFLGASAQLGKVYGTVTEGDGEPAIGASVRLLRDGTPTVGAQSDADGNYTIYNVEPGSYTVEISYAGKITAVKGTLDVSGDYIALDLVANEIVIDDGKAIVEHLENQIPIFKIDPIQPVGITRDQILKNPSRNSKDWMAQQGETYQADAGGALYVGGARSSGTITFIDGAKMIGTEGIPQAAMEQVMLLSGGVPSEYGDANGGVIVISTRNPGMKGYVGQPRSIINIKDRKEKKQKGNPDALLPEIFSENSYVIK